jgi:hypothetical protein
LHEQIQNISLIHKPGEELAQTERSPKATKMMDVKLITERPVLASGNESLDGFINIAVVLILGTFVIDVAYTFWRAFSDYPAYGRTRSASSRRTEVWVFLALAAICFFVSSERRETVNADTTDGS